MRTTSLKFLASAAALIPASAVYAQSSAQDSAALQPRLENGRQIYDTALFARFSPRTALDIVRQIPGYTIQSGNTNERGLGQADGNLIINGARIAGKNNDTETVLGRIPAKSVIRVEIVDGASLSIAGLSGQILNLVTSEDGQNITGSFKWAPQWRKRSESWLSGEASLSIPVKGGVFNLAIENDAGLGASEGPERVTDRFGNLLFIRNELALNRADRPKLSAFYKHTTDGGSIFNANVAYQRVRFRESVETQRTENGRPDIFESYSAREDEWNFEGSADYEFALAGGRLKLIGLQRFEHSPTINFFGQTFMGGLTQPNGNFFAQTVDEGESVLRSEYRWQTGGGSDFSISAEGAYNFLDAKAEIYGLDLVSQPFPGSNSRVEEKRGEIIGSYGRALTDKLTFQTTFGGEYSSISQSGSRGETRSFIRPKGSATLAWKALPDTDLSFSLERKVGQLNFFDFISSVDIANNVGKAGNPSLVPPQSWNTEIEMTQKMGVFGSTTVSAYYNWISDIVDSIPISATEEARGNLPSAKQWGLILTSTFLLDPLGWKGAKIDINAQGQNSRVRDPLTNAVRRISDDFIYSYAVKFRQDIPNSNIAYGGSLEKDDGYPQIRLDQTADFDELRPYAAVFIEHKNVMGLTVNANLGNLLNRGERFVRSVYANRRNGPIAFIEDRTRKGGLIYRLSVSGSF